MNKLNLGSIQIPISAATKTFAILAKRGAGKTYTGAVMAEEFFKNNIPFVVFDPIDVWWGLRFDKNGKDKGLPVIVFGIQHSDILLDRDMGRKIAQAIIKDNISCVISTFGMPKVAQRYLISEFSEEILNINNTPRHIFIEEAHEFVPQRVFGGLGKTFNAVSNLVVMGRNRSLGVTLINQRAATVNKDVLTQLDTLLAFQNNAPQDRKALKDWVEYHAAEGDFEKFMKSLPFLKHGEGWIWSPEFLGIFEGIKIRKRETFHPDPEQTGKVIEMPQLDQIDVQSFIERFNKTIQAVKPSKESLKRPALAVPSKPELPPEHLALIAIRNDYESKLLQKDVEITKRENIIEQIRRIIGGGTNFESPLKISGGNLEMWLKQLDRMPNRILQFLAERPNQTFTRSQIALGIQVSAKGGAYNGAIAHLKRNNLIIEEGSQIKVSPDL